MQAGKRRNQGGFTVVELMVALLIGLFLLGGLLTLVQDNRRSFASQNQLSQLQDAERMAMTMITDVIQSAGYYPDPTANSATLLLPANGTFAAAGQGIAGTPGAAPASDTLSVRYATNPGDTIVNCIGQSNPVGGGVAVYTNTFSVANGQLTCMMNGTAYNIIGTAPAASGNFSGIVVTRMTILYGVTTGSTPNNVDTYYAAGAVPNWGNVISVQVTLTFANPMYTAQAAAQGSTVKPTLSFQRVVTVMGQAGI
jgi:type IV pilus assembly protein PilW